MSEEITDSDLEEIIVGMLESGRFNTSEMDRIEKVFGKIQIMMDKFGEGNNPDYGAYKVVKDSFAIIANPLNVALILKIVKITEEKNRDSQT